MSIITLITDWQSADYYIGALKGKILSKNSKLNIVDVSHQIESYNISMAAFVLKHSYANFPKGTVHIVSVDSEPSRKKSIIAVKYDGHFFVSTDNGILTLVMEENAEEIIEINSTHTSLNELSELDIFAGIATYISEHKDIRELGTTRETLFKLIQIKAYVEESVIVGQILHIDSYGNVITNVSKDLFERVRKNRDFKMYIQKQSNLITKINTSYNQSTEGDLLAIFNSINYLEIAIRKGNAYQLLNLDKKGTSIRIVFENPKKVEQGKLF